MQDYIRKFLEEMGTIAQLLHDDEGQVEQIEKMISIVSLCKEQLGRVFFAGLGGGAGSGSHATNDFFKIAGVSTFCLSDNASLLTALWNDEGADEIFVRQLKGHHFNNTDVLFVFSVNGGKPNISSSLVKATDYAHERGGQVIAVLGRGDGHVGQNADAACVIPILHESRVTPHSESWQLAINHLIVNAIAKNGEWEA